MRVVVYSDEGTQLGDMSIPDQPQEDVELSAQRWVEGKPVFDLISGSWGALGSAIKSLLSEQFPDGFPLDDGRKMTMARKYGVKASNREAAIQAALAAGVDISYQEVSNRKLTHVLSKGGPAAAALAPFKEEMGQTLKIGGEQVVATPNPYVFRAPQGVFLPESDADIIA